MSDKSNKHIRGIYLQKLPVILNLQRNHLFQKRFDVNK